MNKKIVIVVALIIVLIVLGWYFFLESSPSAGTRDYISETRKDAAATQVNSYTDIIVLSSFSPTQAGMLTSEVMKYLKSGTAVRILSANHLSSSYSVYDPESLDFYLSTIFTNTEKSTLNDVCNILTAALADYRSRNGNRPTKVFIFGVLPEAESRDDPALYCLSKFTEDIKAISKKQDIEFFTSIKSEDTLNPLDKDLISLLADNELKVSIIMLN